MKNEKSTNMTETLEEKKIRLLSTGLNTGKFPKFAYKYLSLNARTEDSIKNKALWFSNPTAFNDPFDCNLSEVTNHTLEDLHSYLKNQPEVTLTQRNKMLETFNSSPDIIKESISSSKQVLQKKGILCLSKNYSNILMWSHYASKHSGLVLEFEVEADLDFFMTPVNVEYCTSYDATNYLANGQKTILDNITKKSDYWRYEEEMRIYKMNGDMNYEFKPNALQKIYFGCKTKDADISKYIDLCKNNGLSHIEFLKAKMKHAYFELEFEKI